MQEDQAAGTTKFIPLLPGMVIDQSYLIAVGKDPSDYESSGVPEVEAFCE